MKIRFISILIIIGYFSTGKVFSQTTYVDNGTSNSYTLQSGDSLYIKQGTFTGSVSNWSGGTKITIANGATFKPSGVGGYGSKYIVYGTMTVGSLDAYGGFSLDNYGTVNVTANMQLGSQSQSIINRLGGNIYINGSFSDYGSNNSITNYANITVGSAMTVNGALTNYADISIGGDLSVSSGSSSLTNKKNITANGNVTFYDGQFNNEGKLYSQKTITLGNNLTFTNTCRTIADNGITIYGGTLYNNGLLLAAKGSSFTNGGTINSSGNGVIKTGAFTNNSGNIRGNGYLYITGKSTFNSGTIGTSGTTTDVLNIYTVNRTKTTQIFDDQWGTVNPGAKYAQFAAPDTTGYAQYACAAEYTTLSVLSSTWMDFLVKLSNDLPVVNWSADFEDGIIFTVQRSENGADFTNITSVAVKKSTYNYSFTDNALSVGHTSIIYYRICATLLSGVQKFTEIKSVKLNNTGHLSKQFATPNPFNNTFNIAYSATQKQTLMVRVFNYNGQVVYTRSVPVNIGVNTITVEGTGKWLSGMYFVQLISGNETPVSIKVVKQ